MVLGLGTGSTAAFVVEALAARVEAGLRIVGIPTSERTAAQARRLGVPIATFAEHQRLDLTIDGADEVAARLARPDQGPWRRVAAREDRRRGERAAGHRRRSGKARRPAWASTPRCRSRSTQFGWQATAAALAALGCSPEQRYGIGEQPFVTDGGNYILDCRFGPLADPGSLEKRIAMTVGAVESGLFVGRSSAVVIASADGVEVLTPPARNRP